MGISLSLARLLKKTLSLYCISSHKTQLLQSCLKTHQQFKEISELSSSFLGKLGDSMQFCTVPQSPASISCPYPPAAKAREQEGNFHVWEGEQQHPCQHAVPQRKERWAAMPLLVAGHEM